MIHTFNASFVCTVDSQLNAIPWYMINAKFMLEIQCGLEVTTTNNRVLQRSKKFFNLKTVF